MTPSSYGPFDVSLSQNLRDEIDGMRQAAESMGIGERFLVDLAEVIDFLERSPREWGDPLNNLPAMKLKMYRGIHAKLSVTYGVHERIPIVFVSKVKPILNHPLADESG